VQERDILGTQLIRRNDELALLHEKIKIQQSILKKGTLTLYSLHLAKHALFWSTGEVQYRERIQEIRRLKTLINDTRRQLQIRSHEVGCSGFPPGPRLVLLLMFVRAPQVTNIDALKNEIYHIQRELLQVCLQLSFTV
jgi:hypothetical protein